MKTFLGSVLAIGLTLSAGPSAQSAGIALGAYVNDKNDGGLRSISELESTLCQLDIVCRTLALDYHYEKFHWDTLSAEHDDITAGRTPVIAWAENSTDLPYAGNIINGNYDTLIQQDAILLNQQTTNHTVIIEFIPEMQDCQHTRLGIFYGGATSWCASSATKEAAGQLYRQAQSHIVQLMRPYVPNAKFVFAPQSSAYHTFLGAQKEWTWFYPGASTVDYLGADNRTGQSDLADDSNFQAFYTEGSSTGLPLMMTEVCPTGDATSFINSARLELPPNYPGIVSFVYNDGTSDDGGNPTGCAFTAHAGSLDAYGTMAADPNFQGTIP